MSKSRCLKNTIIYLNIVKYNMTVKLKLDFVLMNKYFSIIKYCFIENNKINLLLFLAKLTPFLLIKIQPLLLKFNSMIK
jgi:hypothetical protein